MCLHMHSRGFGELFVFGLLLDEFPSSTLLNSGGGGGGEYLSRGGSVPSVPPKQSLGMYKFNYVLMQNFVH